MRTFILFAALLLSGLAGQAQQSEVYASSAWTRVRIKAAPLKRTMADNFTTNRNRWKTGNQGGYVYEFTQTGYRFRRQAREIKQPAFSFIRLPEDMDLNKVDSFMVQVEITTNPGVVPVGGLLFGVKDTANYCHFQLNAGRQVSVRSVVNGVSFATYMRGSFVPAGVPVANQKNVLKIVKRKEQLHFYVNDREVQTSPYEFRPLPGNGIGFVSPGWMVTFRNLTVTTGSRP